MIILNNNIWHVEHIKTIIIIITAISKTANEITKFQEQ